MSSHPTSNKPVVPVHKTAWLRTLQAVVWSFIGLRSKAEFENDSQQLNPIHLVLAGFACVALFIGTLVLIAHWAVKVA